MLERVKKGIINKLNTCIQVGWDIAEPEVRNVLADDILSIKVYKGYTIKDLIERGLIVADDQSLPSPVAYYCTFPEVVEQELKNYNFRKVIPKEGE